MESPWGEVGEEEMYDRNDVQMQDSMYTASTVRVDLYTRTWMPKKQPPRAVICMLHGYNNDISWTFQNTPIHLVSKLGVAAVAVDLQGHGRSQGLRAHVPDVRALAHDLAALFRDKCSSPLLSALPRFLYGESFGGAICLLIHLLSGGESDEAWRGAVLVAPMCRISDCIRPAWPLVHVLTVAAWFLPTLPIVPTEDILNKAVKSEDKRKILRSNPRRYNGKPRLGTSLELLRVTDFLAVKLSEVDIPFLVLHGDADVVTDPAVSKELYQVARSKDKTLKTYEGLGHSLLFGESDEDVAMVRSDICDWISKRI